MGLLAWRGVAGDFRAKHGSILPTSNLASMDNWSVLAAGLTGIGLYITICTIGDNTIFSP